MNTTKTTADTDAEFSWIEAPFKVIESYFENQHLDRLVRHQIESYNHFATFQLQRTIQMFNPIIVHSDLDYMPDFNKYTMEIQLTMENFKLYPPMIHENNGATKLMFPQEARLRNFTYASNMTVDIQIQYHIREPSDPDNLKIVTKTIPKVNIGKLPIMLKSSICLLTQNKHMSPVQTGECKYDCGGYFIINGSEKTVLAQERAAENKVYCFRGDGSKWSWYAEVKSVPDTKCISAKQLKVLVANKSNGFGNGIFIQIPRVKQPVEIFIVFRALGAVSDKEIVSYIVPALADEAAVNFLRASIMDGNKCLTQEDAVRYIASHVSYIPINMEREAGLAKKREFAGEVLANDLFPHCKTVAQKIYFMGYMVGALLERVFGRLPPDDRDSYSNKRIDATGTLLNNLFRNYLNKMVKEVQKQGGREINSSSWKKTKNYDIITKMNVSKMFKSTTIENGFKRALSTGDFSIKQSNSSKVGTAQVLNRLTYAGSLSHLRRINTPFDKSNDLVDPRKLHNTTWGYLCQTETPEGQSIGVVKNLAYMTHLTIASNPAPLYEYVAPFITPVEELAAGAAADAAAAEWVRVFVNGAWVGITERPLDLYRDMKEKKVRGVINVYTSVVFNYKLREIRICNDGGRLTRPLLRVRDNKVLLTADILERLCREIHWNDLLYGVAGEAGIIEYIDPEEQDCNVMIAMTHKDLAANVGDEKMLPKRYTHCEIHPSTIFGLLGSCIPFPDHNQAPRNCYQVAMSKQSMGVYATNFDRRMDKTAYVLTTPMRPLVDTRIMDFIKVNEIPSGAQIVVAIMTHTGYNQEDSILMNKGAIDRGLFAATIYHTEKDENTKVNGDDECRCRPDPTKTKNMKFGNYSKLNAQGFLPENSYVANRDVIIGKVVPIKENKNDPTKVIKFEDKSKVYKTAEDTYIDRNYVCRNGDGYKIAKVTTRTWRKPVVGDKFASRAAQKGTVGLIVPEEDMPFVGRTGLRPDIIINPHCQPSRMTTAQLKECLLSKILVELGLFGDGTAFGDTTIEFLAECLQKVGYESYGNEVMYNALTGEQIEANIFIGPTFYQRLKHMVNDKVHSRATGPMVLLTRQPNEGRSKGGGLKLGEMEKDCLISGGYSSFLRERFYISSDKYQINVCRKCGIIAAFNDKHGIHLCKMCENRTEFDCVEVPFGFKLMMQELQTINVVPRLITA